MKIVSVALRLNNGLVISLSRPNRHCNILNNLYEIFPEYKQFKPEQGFLTNEGAFVDRFLAKALAIEFGQIKTPNTHLFSELISEDLW